MIGLLGGWVPVVALDNANERVAYLEDSEKAARAQAEAALVALDAFVRAGKFEVSAEMWDDLSEDAQNLVAGRLAKRVEDALRKQGALQRPVKAAAS
jgi:hypothetical protein